MSFPLLCGDIILEAFHRRMLLAADLLILERISKEYHWHEPPIAVANALIWENKVVLVTNPGLQILHATENIFAMNGYLPKEVIGKSPKMFQGELTEPIAKNRISLAVAKQQLFETRILNYRKDGSSYHCHIEGYPIFNKQGMLASYIALEHLIA